MWQRGAIRCWVLAAHGGWLGALLWLCGCDPNVIVGSQAEAEVDAGPLEITWRSGAHAGSDLAAYTEFAEWRGRALDVATVYADRSQGWDATVNPAWPLDMLGSFSGQLVLSLPLYPDGSGNNQDCAAGAYDAQWRRLGPFLSAHGRANSILRLGWGWNDLEHDWQGVNDLGNWIACFRRVVRAIRSSLPQVEIEWSFNPPGPPKIAGDDPYAAYPGDEYVDYVGLEAFDMYPPLRDRAAWDAHCESAAGLCKLMSFAREHNKRVGIGEWGLAACGGDPGGDNPFFVQRVVETFARNRDVMGYESYFEEGQGEVCSDLRASARLTRAAALYRMLYRKP